MDVILPRASVRAAPPSLKRVALLSVHTCPLDQPGTGDSGGMNVYVRQVARRLAEMGVEVDVFTRWAGSAPRIRVMEPGVRVIHLEAGPAAPVPKAELPDHLCEFLYALMRFEAAEAERLGVGGPIYDVIHSHYWLSGRVGRMAAERWSVPLVQSFHTLGLVKNATRGPDEAPEPSERIAAERRIVEAAERILAPTPVEAAELTRLYRADPARVRVVSPGVDTDRFVAGPSEKAELGLAGRTVVGFVGRLQPLKAPDLALRAVAELAARAPALDPVLLVIGGPSGAGVTVESLRSLAMDLGVSDRLVIHDPVPHHEMPVFYRSLDALIVPSRTESFGLVAIEASACGVPVVASDVGGLRTAVRDQVTGVLVPDRSPEAFADALGRILSDPTVRDAMGAAGARYARRFDWRAVAAGLLGVYEEVATAAAVG